jgi:hypothetical protein
MVRCKRTISAVDAGDSSGMQFLEREIFWTIENLDQDEADDRDEEDEPEDGPDKVM